MTLQYSQLFMILMRQEMSLLIMIWKKISDWTYIQMEKTIQPKLEQISPRSYLFKKDIEANSLTIHFNNFTKEKWPGIRRCLKKCLFPEKLFFLKLNQKCQKQLLIRGIWPIPAHLGHPNALFLNKGALFLKRKALFPRTILIWFSF